MEIAEQRQGAVTVLKPQGPLTGADADVLKEKASQLAMATLGRIALDMSAIPFVDSRGLEVLVELANDLSQSGRSLKVCGMTETVREILDLTGLVSHFEHFADSVSAVRSFL